MSVFTFDPGSFGGRKVNIKRPLEIAHFSHDQTRQVKVNSDESLRYYCPPFINVPIADPPFVTLRAGFDTFQKYDDSGDEHLDSLLVTLEQVERQTGQCTKAEFITWRGMMTKIATALFEDEDGFEMLATRFQGTIFIEEDHRAKVARNAASTNRRPNARHQAIPREEMEYWGYKFESLSMLRRPFVESSREEIEARSSQVVENGSQYCSIVQTSLGDKTIIIAGEVDGVIGEKAADAADPPRWVELKTSKKPSTPRDFQFHSKKLMKWWAQSYLIGCPTIVVGWRDQQGVLVEIEHLSTQAIPGGVAKTPFAARWNATACLVAASAFLDFVRETITKGEFGGYRDREKANGMPSSAGKRAKGLGRYSVRASKNGDYRSYELFIS